MVSKTKPLGVCLKLIRGKKKGEIKIMSRWQIQGTGDYYARYSAYEKYLRANAKDLGLSEAQVNEQLGRYAYGLQQKSQYEPEDRIKGKNKAKSIGETQVKGNPNNVTQELEKTTKQLEVLKQDLGKGATSTTYFGTPEQLRNAAPLGNIAPEIPVKSEFQKALEKSQLYKTTSANSVDKLGKRKQKQILEEIEKLGKLAKTDEEINQLKQLTEKFRGGNDQKAFSEAVQTQAANLDKQKAVENKPSEPKTWQKYAEAHGTQYKAPEKFGGIEADKKAQEIIDANKNKGARTTILGSPEEYWRNYEQNKPRTAVINDFLDDAERINPQAETVDDILDDAAKLKTEAEAASKESKGFMNSVKNAMKGKKGKVALAAGALAAIGLGAYALFGGKDDDKVDETEQKMDLPKSDNVNPEKDQSEPVEETPSETQDSIPVKTEQVPPVVTVPVDQAPVEEAENNEPEETEKVEEQEAEKPVTSAEDTEEGKQATEPQEQEETAENQIKEEYIVQKGDSFWNLAKKHLMEAHKDDPDYKPTNKEIYDLTMKFLKDNNYKLDENNYYPNPMLHPGDKLNLAA